MSEKVFTCGYCFAFYPKGEGCGCKDAQFDRANKRIKAMNDVVEAAKVMKRYYDANPLEVKSDLQKLLFKMLEETQDG
jgi:hypothetical protein